MTGGMLRLFVGVLDAFLGFDQALAEFRAGVVFDADHEIRIKVAATVRAHDRDGIGLAVGIAVPPPHEIGFIQRRGEAPLFLVQAQAMVVASQPQATVEKFQPQRMAIAVLFADVAVVVDPILVAGVVGRINVNHPHPVGVSRL